MTREQYLIRLIENLSNTDDPVKQSLGDLLQSVLDCHPITYANFENVLKRLNTELRSVRAEINGIFD